MNFEGARDLTRKDGGEDPQYTETSPPRRDVDDERRERRRRVLDDAMEDALALSDPFDKLLGASTAMLARLEAAIGERVVATLEDPEAPLEDSAPGFDMHMRVTRQIERNLQLRRRDRESLRREKEIPPRLWNRLDS